MKSNKTLEEVTEYAKQFEGVPYIWAGNSFLKGLDCSGYLQHLLLFMGLYDFQDRTCKGIYQYCQGRSAKTCLDKKPGHIFFYGKSAKSIEHIAFGISESELIEAGGAGENCTTRKAAKLLNANVRIKPINHRKDFLFSIPISYKESL